MRKNKLCGLLASALLLLTGACGLATADEAYPARPIHILVGFTPGGSNDILARAFGQKMSEQFGRPVVVENRPGAGGISAAESLKRASPDGYTILVGASGAMAVSPAVYSSLSYEPTKDMEPISNLGSFPLIMIAGSKSPIKSVRDLLEFAKANPTKANYASASTSFQLATELFKQKTGIQLQMIPYKGSNDSILAVINGEVSIALLDAGAVVSHIKGGQVRALAVAAPKRMVDLPDVPTMKEAGVDFEVDLWSGMFAPKGTPKEVIDKLQNAFARIAKEPDIQQRMRAIGIEPIGDTSAEFSSRIEADIKQWKAVAQSAHIQIGR
ncbi:tripartite tricarboxylate transporter substrate binding protein [Microbacteriaceae bacterium K1510]|nr:tripartite tricarboxylate transporter substrate binding protein [Microbacteriaceae bacterium K1510]